MDNTSAKLQTLAQDTLGVKVKCKTCGDGRNAQTADTFYEDTFKCRDCGLTFGQGREYEDDDECTASS